MNYLSKLFERMKKDKAKSVTVVVALIVFITGIVVSAINTGDTHAAYLDDHYCSSGSVVTDGSSYYCCPSGYFLNGRSCKKTGGANDINEATAACGSGTLDNFDRQNYTYTCSASATAAIPPYTVTFNANGGTGGPSTQKKVHNVILTLNSDKPTKTHYTFVGWGISPNSTEVKYSSGSKYEDNSSITLYAIYEPIIACYYCDND